VWGQSGPIIIIFFKQNVVDGNIACWELLNANCTSDMLQYKPVLYNKLFQECQNAANGGKFRLRDLLSVPMQRVLKYHLLLKVIMIILQTINVSHFYYSFYWIVTSKILHLFALFSISCSLPSQYIQIAFYAWAHLLIPVFNIFQRVWKIEAVACLFINLES